MSQSLRQLLLQMESAMIHFDANLRSELQNLLGLTSSLPLRLSLPSFHADLPPERWSCLCPLALPEARAHLCASSLVARRFALPIHEHILSPEQRGLF